MKLCPRCEEAFPDDAGFCPFDAERLQRSSDPLIGRTLAARYRLVRGLGTGGMALVYLARHVMIDRRSAIKILRQDLATNPVHRERFLREARAVNRINHPNIVEITDFGEDGGLVFLVMEYVEGQSLLAPVEGGPMACKRSVRIALQIASALARAHELGVIHRDLKPENVLLCVRDGDDLVKLTDFGIAKIVDAPALTFSEQRFGTPGYIAPEYIEGAPASPGGDLYALGIVLYEMLTARLPFDARFPAELLALQMTAAPIKPSARTAGIPAELEDLVMRLIERRPADRPRDAFAVQDALQEILNRIDGRPVAAAGASPAVRERRPPKAEADSVPSEVPARWQASLAELELRVDAARRGWGDGDPRAIRARDLVDFALSLHASLARAGATVAEHQANVDRLEAAGREFRATLGNAIDTLSRDRSRECARLDGLALRRVRIHEAIQAPSANPRIREELRAEMTAVQADEARAREVETDLGFQISTLERELDGRNERLDVELADATGKLEGALSAVRRLTREIARTREEAMRALGSAA
ncbi:MAG TPA: serine/threonine-protein kinase [Polyangiaceae bacterium]|jgi:serine/threonine-protein kinase|nr:serine/threonine-protein kinase [Polyangiaceae bacterium]